MSRFKDPTLNPRMIWFPSALKLEIPVYSSGCSIFEICHIPGPLRHSKSTAHVLKPQHICVLLRGCKIDFPCQQLAPCSVHSWNATCTCQPKIISHIDLHFLSGPKYGEGTPPKMG